MKIALIDDGVNINETTKEYIAGFLELEDGCVEFTGQKSMVSLHSHGTLCSAIIKKYSKSAEIYSLKILKSESLSSNIDKLGIAFLWCIANHVKVINLSLGTVNGRDFGLIREWVKKLKKAGIIIVAALNNNNTYTLPASLSSVIGIKTDASTELVKSSGSSPIGTDALAASSHAVQLNESLTITTPSCNSFAAPVVSGLVCDCLAGLGDSAVIKSILNKKAEEKSNSLYDDLYDGITTCDLNNANMLSSICIENKKLKKVPIVNIRCEKKELKTLNSLFLSDNFFPLVMYSEGNNYCCGNSKLRHIIYKLSTMFDCDIVLMYNITNIPFDCDLYLKWRHNKFVLQYRKIFREKKESITCVKDTYNRILKILCDRG